MTLAWYEGLPRMTWVDGLRRARADYAEHPYDLGQALMLFRMDPPDTSFQRGYLAGVKQLARIHCPEILRIFQK